MPGKALVLLMLVTTCVVGTGYFLSADNTSTFEWLNIPFSDSVRQDIPAGQAIKDRHLATTQSAPRQPGDNALGFMLTSIADQYTQNTRYPSWSIPLSPAQARGYQGNRYHPVSLPLGDDGHFTVTLEKYRFTKGESILVVASLTGPQVVSDRLQATLEATQVREAVASTNLDSSDSRGFYEGSLESDEDPGEYRLIVEAQVDGKPVRHVSTLTIEPYLGDFEGLGDTYLNDNNLVIPVHFSPETPGFYALSAQLYAGQTPIAQLQSEQRLDMGADTILLKAHGTVLANREVQGQLELRNLQIRQLPARPGERTNYAFGPEEGYSFSPPDLENLRDAPSVDPESERRAALLRQLADKF
ncbi:hypothetical protein QQF73_08390 [Marinobacter sp. M216]|uniref:Uncharacterized protein n=1 Tax=Marinobacter albus TaxID=3030833 RepID=A0ABT7HBA1_9GAMM|nr:hypothetical protein [Marinobacter sp. M216]MDK9557638.1 hypothetical protein [Marinobacter sp. M216]